MNGITINRQNPLEILLKFFLIYRVIISFIPASSIYLPMIFNFLTLLIIYVFLIMLAGIDMISKTLLRFTPLYLVNILKYCMASKWPSLPVFLYGFLQFSMWPIVVCYVLNRKQYSYAKLLLGTSITCVLFTSITTVLGNVAFPGASRLLAAIWSENPALAQYYTSLNIGGFDFVYMLVMFLPLLAPIIQYQDNKVYKLFFFIFCLLSIFTIIKTEYTTAVILSLIAPFAILFPRLLSNKSIFLITLVVLICIAPITLLLDNISETVESTVISERLLNLSNLMQGKAVDGDLESRLELYTISLRSFAQNPFWGGSQIGGHSLVFDIVGYFGVIGILILCFIFRQIYMVCIRPFKGDNSYKYLILVYLIQILLAVLNTTIIFNVFFFFIPLIGLITHPIHIDNNQKISWGQS